MFIAQHQTYVAPAPKAQNTFDISKKRVKHTHPFTLVQGAPPSQPQNSTFFPLTRTKNYFQNRSKLTQTDRNDSLERFQKLHKQANIQNAYSVPWTTFFDLTRPKKALSLLQNTPTDPALQTLYQARRRARMLRTYQNDEAFYNTISKRSAA